MYTSLSHACRWKKNDKRQKFESRKRESALKTLTLVLTRVCRSPGFSRHDLAHQLHKVCSFVDISSRVFCFTPILLRGEGSAFNTGGADDT